MLSVLMAGARKGQLRPSAAETVNLLCHAATSRLRQGPPPGSFARRHPRGIIATRIPAGLWLVFLTVFLCQYTLWPLFMLVFVALHAYFAARTVTFMRDERDGEPPDPTSTGR